MTQNLFMLNEEAVDKAGKKLEFVCIVYCDAS